MILVKVGVVFFLSYLLGLIAGKQIKVLEKIVKSFRIGHFAGTAVIMSLATSIPEMTVAISSSIVGSSSLAFGNALGANIANLSLVLGITAIVGGSLHFLNHGETKKNLGYLVYGFIPFIFLTDLTISRFEGLLMILAYVWYLRDVVWVRREKKFEINLTRKSKFKEKVWLLGQLIFWIVMIIGVAQIIIYFSKEVATALNLPLLFIGLFVISVGTTLPELAFNIRAVRQRKVTMSLGNIVGSCVTNATLVLGLSALINPIQIKNWSVGFLSASEYFFLAVIVGVFVRSKQRLDRFEGVILASLFFMYAAIELLF